MRVAEKPLTDGGRRKKKYNRQQGREAQYHRGRRADHLAKRCGVVMMLCNVFGHAVENTGTGENPKHGHKLAEITGLSYA
ncbi:hypothetical protein D3C72_2408880 [compost metagenome]